ncbi:MAG: RNA polymerase sigma factor [Aureliella sp.]
MTTDSSTSTNLSLLERVSANESKAWQSLVNLYRPLVAFWCRRAGVVENQIDDLIQDVFFSVVRSLDQYQPTRENGSFRAWLWTITRNKIIDSARAGKRNPPARGGSTALHATREIAEQIDPSDETERTQWSHLVHRALAQVQNEFEEKTYQAFWRSTIDNVPVAQVAKELGLGAATIRKYRSRILRRLRQQLGDS